MGSIPAGPKLLALFFFCHQTWRFFLSNCRQNCRSVTRVNRNRNRHRGGGGGAGGGGPPPPPPTISTPGVDSRGFYEAQVPAEGASDEPFPPRQPSGLGPMIPGCARDLAMRAPAPDYWDP